MKLKIIDLFNYILAFFLALVLSSSYGRETGLVEQDRTPFIHSHGSSETPHNNLICNEIEEDIEPEGSQKNQLSSKFLTGGANLLSGFNHRFHLSSVNINLQTPDISSSGTNLFLLFRNLRL
jgi:hypothetical protein